MSRAVLGGLAGGAAIVGVLFLPLLVHELQTGFQETRLVTRLRPHAVAVRSIGGGPVSAIAFTLLRVIGWPLIGLVTDVPAAERDPGRGRRRHSPPLGSCGLAAQRRQVFAGSSGSSPGARSRWRSRRRHSSASSPGLPNDHYHAFVDPIVVILIGVPAAGFLSRALDAWRSTRRPNTAIAVIAIAADLMALVAVTVIRTPPAVDPNGGWPAMRDAGVRVAAFAAGRPVFLYGLPEFKLPDTLGFPIEFAGNDVADRTGTNGIPKGRRPDRDRLRSALRGRDRQTLRRSSRGRISGHPHRDDVRAWLGPDGRRRPVRRLAADVDLGLRPVSRSVVGGLPLLTILQAPPADDRPNAAPRVRRRARGLHDPATRAGRRRPRLLGGRPREPVHAPGRDAGRLHVPPPAALFFAVPRPAARSRSSRRSGRS